VEETRRPSTVIRRDTRTRDLLALIVADLHNTRSITSTTAGTVRELTAMYTGKSPGHTGQLTCSRRGDESAANASCVRRTCATMIRILVPVDVIRRAVVRNTADRKSTATFDAAKPTHSLGYPRCPRSKTQYIQRTPTGTGPSPCSHPRNESRPHK
jgi:hypothetical protein